MMKNENIEGTPDKSGGVEALDELETRVEERTKELIHSDALFRAVVNHSPNKIHIKDLEGRYLLINEEAGRLFGITGEEGRGKTSYDLFEKDVADAFTAHDQSVIKSGKATEDEEEFVLDDGVHTYLTTKFPIFEEGEVTGIGAIGSDITDRKKLEAKLQMLADTDGLTGLFNRRFLDKTLSKELTRANRYGLELSILMFDVDHFKKFNDTHGHEQGDRVLQSLARTLRDSLRTIDFACRYGGEEFLIIMPCTTAEGAMILAERLREGVENTLVDGLNVAISIGVAGISEHHPENSAQFIVLADTALYVAKEKGRNQVVMAQIPEAA